MGHYYFVTKIKRFWNFRPLSSNALLTKLLIKGLTPMGWTWERFGQMNSRFDLTKQEGMTMYAFWSSLFSTDKFKKSTYDLWNMVLKA
jgi:hypothetical protein